MWGGVSWGVRRIENSDSGGLNPTQRMCVEQSVLGSCSSGTGIKLEDRSRQHILAAIMHCPLHLASKGNQSAANSGSSKLRCRRALPALPLPPPLRAHRNVNDSWVRTMLTASSGSCRLVAACPCRAASQQLGQCRPLIKCCVCQPLCDALRCARFSEISWLQMRQRRQAASQPTFSLSSDRMPASMAACFWKRRLERIILRATGCPWAWSMQRSTCREAAWGGGWVGGWVGTKGTQGRRDSLPA